MAYEFDPLNWCVRCGVHAAAVDRCPVCLDQAKQQAEVLMASRCRG